MKAYGICCTKLLLSPTQLIHGLDIDSWSGYEEKGGGSDLYTHLKMTQRIIKKKDFIPNTNSYHWCMLSYDHFQGQTNS